MDLPIEIRYTPKRKDYVHASRVLARHTPGFLIIATVILLVMAIAVVILIFPEVGNATWRNIALVALLVGAFYVVYYFLFIPLQLSKAYKTNEHLQMERKFIFTDERVLMEIGDNATEFKWENFQKVIEGDGYYLMIFQADERVYPFVPKDAFVDQEVQDSFLQLLAHQSIPLE